MVASDGSSARGVARERVRLAPDLAFPAGAVGEKCDEQADAAASDYYARTLNTIGRTRGSNAAQTSSTHYTSCYYFGWASS